MPHSSEFERMLDDDSATMELQIDRVPDDGLTFSAASMDAAIKSLGAWVGSRIMRQWNATDQAPRHVHITITVEVT